MTDDHTTRRTLLVDAFTTDPLSGNPAGLVPDADGLGTEAMEAIARELNASETAFLESGECDRRIRYFTPTGEIDLCGHATVAAGAWIARSEREGSYTFETNVGSIDVDVSGGVVWMDGEVAEVTRTELDYDRVASALGADPATLADIGADLPLAIASVGIRYLVVPMNFLQALSGLNPDPKALTGLSEELDVTGIYAFTFDTLGGESTLHGRTFAPRVGIEEDPVTGTASGAVAAYLRAFDAFEGEFPEKMLLEQGHFLDRPGRVFVRAKADPISIGGRAVTTLEGEMAVPRFDDDEILEL